MGPLGPQGGLIGEALTGIRLGIHHLGGPEEEKVSLCVSPSLLQHIQSGPFKLSDDHVRPHIIVKMRTSANIFNEIDTYKAKFKKKD